jgi:hypothetical protein
MAGRYSARVWLALGTIYVVWGSTFMAITIAVRDVPPLVAMGVRHVTAGALLLAWALPRGDRERDPLGRREVRAGFVFGGALFLLGHGGLAWAQQTIPWGGVRRRWGCGARGGTTSRQTLPCRPMRSRTPTRRKPHASCRWRLASFSGKTPARSVQTPTSSEAPISA